MSDMGENPGLGSTGGAARWLCGWKEIAAFLGVGVETARRWHRERGLPIYRPRRPRGGVQALRAEVDAWRCQQGR
jgi:hypothetical protein